MPSAPLPPNEADRLKELDRYAILSTPPEITFDRITKLASFVFHCPVALLSFVEGKRQWFKSCVGVDFREGLRSESFCAWAILNNHVMVVPDATADPRFSNNPLVTGAVGIRFYAGAPLISPRGHKLGTLCIIDTKPRPEGLTPEETAALATFAAMAVSALDARLIAQESEETHALLQTTFASIGDGVIVTDAKSNITFLNPVAEELTGWKLDDALNLPIDVVFKIVHETSREHVANPISKAVSASRVVGLENHTVLLTNDGREIPVDDSAAPIYRGKSLVGGVLIFRDVTKRRIAERLIEEDRKRWRELLLQTPAGIAVLRGPQHRFEWANPEYARLVGRPAQTLAGKTAIEALPEIEAQAHAKLLDGVFQTGKPFEGREALVRLNQGGVMRDVYVNFVYLPTRDSLGAIDGIFVHVIDVTDMVAARHAIEEREAQFRTLAESIPHLAWMADKNGDIFWYNKRWFDFTGTTLAEMQGWGWQSIHDPEILPQVLETWRNSIATGHPFEMMFPLKGANGRFRTFLTRVEPVKDSAGQVARWFGTNTDITEHRRIEESLRRINRDLEQFSYVASHDLQEPLRMIGIYTELMLRGKESSPKDLEQFSGYVLEGVKRMQTLIDDLLSFSRSVYADELAIGSADLSSALGEALSVLNSRIAETGAILNVSTLPITRGDTPQMAHVFQNILSNALKYRKLDIQPQIRVSAKREAEIWVISISDNGIGFAPEYAERIFALFKRLHKDEYPGTGLGLAICKRIVERYGGHMWATSIEGEGSTFFFSLPATDA